MPRPQRGACRDLQLDVEHGDRQGVAVRAQGGGERGRRGVAGPLGARLQRAHSSLAHPGTGRPPGLRGPRREACGPHRGAEPGTDLPPFVGTDLAPSCRARRRRCGGAIGVHARGRHHGVTRVEFRFNI